MSTLVSESRMAGLRGPAPPPTLAASEVLSNLPGADRHVHLDTIPVEPYRWVALMPRSPPKPGAEPGAPSAGSSDGTAT